MASSIEVCMLLVRNPLLAKLRREKVEVGGVHFSRYVEVKCVYVSVIPKTQYGNDL
jgi:hypothetical protein